MLQIDRRALAPGTAALALLATVTVLWNIGEARGNCRARRKDLEFLMSSPGIEHAAARPARDHRRVNGIAGDITS